MAAVSGARAGAGSVPAQSYAQLKAALWTMDSAHVHAVVDGAVVAGLPARLAESTPVTGGWDCLRRGYLSPDVNARAAFLVELLRESPFTDWLLSEATRAFPDWGVVMVSTQGFLPMREHCRALCDVVSPDGRWRVWRWYDPQLLRALLPALAPSQLDELFALGQSMVLCSTQGWTWQAMEQGVLSTQTRPMLPAAA